MNLSDKGRFYAFIGCLLAGLVYGAGMMSAPLSTHLHADKVVWQAGFILTAAFVAAVCLLPEGGRKTTWWILPILAMLSHVGLLFIWRLNPDLFYYQLTWLLLGLGVFIFIVSILPTILLLQRYKYLLGAAAALLLLATMLFGSDIGGNRNWIVIASMSVQPSEIARLFFVLFLAGFLTDKQATMMQQFSLKNRDFWLPFLHSVSPLLLFWAMSMGLLVLQRDLGAALLFYGTAVMMIYAATGRLKYLCGGTAAFVGGAAVCYLFFSHVRVRFSIWLDPFHDPYGVSYQVVQSLYAFAAGKLFGTGLGQGVPTIIPAIHTDFILAAIGEEWGLAAVASIIALYWLLVFALFNLARRQHSLFAMLVCCGFAALFGLQAFMIAGGVMKLAPLTGVTLPFVSYGGSSILSSFLLWGLVYVVAKRT